MTVLPEIMIYFRRAPHAGNRIAFFIRSMVPDRSVLISDVCVAVLCTFTC